MFNNNSLSEKTFQMEGWSKQRLVLAVKQLDGKLFLDVRKWTFDEARDFKKASEKGLMLNIDHWKKMLPEIDLMLKSIEE